MWDVGWDGCSELSTSGGEYRVKLAQARAGPQEVTLVSRWCLCSPELGSPSSAATSSCRVRGAETPGGGSGPSAEVSYSDK